jgi:glutaminyl-peptide cyclotransferase
MRRSRLFRLYAPAAMLFFLAGCSPSANTQPEWPEFNGDRAYDLLKKQVALGPRVPGTDSHAAGEAFIIESLRPYADEVTTQRFTAMVGSKRIPMINIIANFHQRSSKWVLIAAHWDTRPTADQEVIGDKRNQPIPGANDGASGVAALLELARIFREQPPPVNVMLLFLDGEDYGPGESAMFLGAKHFASEAEANKIKPNREKIIYGILLDMVGDRDLAIPQEAKSLEAAPEVMKKIWDKAADLGYHKEFPSKRGMAISDDHLPLIAAGIKCVDLIDFDYGPWHTLDDTPDKCSAKSLKTIGEVVAAVVYGEKSQ